MVTLNEIAQRAGVSTIIASRVLNGGVSTSQAVIRSEASR